MYFMYHICKDEDIGNYTEGYIGITNNPRQRWWQHLSEVRGTKTYPLYRAMRKYKVSFHIVSFGDKEFIEELEQLIRPKLRLGWNIVTGGSYRDGKGTAMYGRKHTKETLSKMSEIKKGNSYKLGHKASTETKERMSKAQKGLLKPKITCPYCGKVGGSNAMRRYHFDNCKVQR